MTLTGITALVLLTGPSSAAAPPDAAAAEEGGQLVEQFVEDVRTMRGRFEQKLVDANGEVVETSSGTFAIRRPGQLRWAYREPYDQVLVADGQNVWSYDVDLAQVTVKAQAKVLSSTPALVLGGSENVLDDFEVEASFEDAGTQWVRLAPRRPDSSFRSVELGFTDGSLSRMIFYDNLDQTTLVALFDVTLNEEIDPATFRFIPPEGVDVVGTPAPVSTGASPPPAAGRPARVRPAPEIAGPRRGQA
jgi:outer membrane lipoprotein carrier protein